VILGIDCGSVSVKMVLLEGDKLIAQAYLKNHGLIPTIQEGLKQLPKVKIDCAGVTGSGKEFVSSLIGGDYTDSEVMCHCESALKRYPNAKTIMDIGGEDSKLMLVKNGILVDFQMNKVCGAGAGAMIETIASRLGVSIEQVGSIALRSKNRLNLPAKCGIFLQSEVVSQLNKGRALEDILMGVCRGMVGNYLLLTKGKTIGETVILQGAVAKNQGVVKAFEEALNCPVIVPEHPELAGAIGIALLTGEQNITHTRYRGDAIFDTKYRTEVRYCNGIDGCQNHCELLYLYYGDKVLTVSGSRCERLNK